MKIPAPTSVLCAKDVVKIRRVAGCTVMSLPREVLIAAGLEVGDRVEAVGTAKDGINVTLYEKNRSLPVVRRRPVKEEKRLSR